MQVPAKTISETLSRYQSAALVTVVGSVVVLCALEPLVSPHLRDDAAFPAAAVMVSLTFAIVVWALRAGTPGAAIFGALICEVLTCETMLRDSLLHSALTPLFVLFLLTFAAGRMARRKRPEFSSASEVRRGRTAAQVLANLGCTVVIVAICLAGRHAAAYLPVLAALAEATADTVSSELGQAFGGVPYLLTTLRRAAPKTDGAVSPLGTVAGLLGAALVTAAGAWAVPMGLREGLAVFFGAAAGLLFDSLLGATVERRGWVNNDLVNFFSTVFAAVVAWLLGVG